MQDETLNYSLIKLIVCLLPCHNKFALWSDRFYQVALNEQFMVASVPSSHGHGIDSEGSNRIISVLTRRLNSSKTFGENMIFMLNRAGKFKICQCSSIVIK